MLTPGQKAASVSELVAHIKHTLEETFHEVMVEGEITNISHAHSGHCYFNLIDQDASVSCALFRQDLLRHPGFKNIKEGDRVLVYGPLTVYQKRGSFQILAKRVMPAGEGIWRLRLEALKKKLAGEGLFDPERKRPLPAFPRRIAVITAPGGAALHDFLNVYHRRSMGYEIVIVPALVQGDKAPASMIKALDMAEEAGGFDVIVLTRGGGSSEDLWCFNDEALIRRMARAATPVISAVGHEVDWTLADHVADLRCETPTAAAETLTQPQTEVRRRLREAHHRLVTRLSQQRSELHGLLVRYHPRQVIGIVLARLQEQSQWLERMNPLTRAHQYLPVAQRGMELDELFRRLERGLVEQTRRLRTRMEMAQAHLAAMNPRAVLERGYSIVTVADTVVSSQQQWDQLADGKRLTLSFHDGDGTAQKTAKERT